MTLADALVLLGAIVLTLQLPDGSPERRYRAADREDDEADPRVIALRPTGARRERALTKRGAGARGGGRRVGGEPATGLD